MSCDPYSPAVHVACTDCPVPADVDNAPKGAVNSPLTDSFDKNAAVLRCLTDQCTGAKSYETLKAAAPVADLYGSSSLDSTDNAVDATLADGKWIGQEKYFIMTEASNSSTVTVANHETSNPEVFTFAATTAYLMLKWSGTEWVTIAATATV